MNRISKTAGEHGTKTLLSLSSLQALLNDSSYKPVDMVNGPPNAHSRLRLFGSKEKDVRVTLFRDHHAWCPYCEKTLLWLEEKKIPYHVSKITMRCYGELVAVQCVC